MKYNKILEMVKKIKIVSQLKKSAETLNFFNYGKCKNVKIRNAIDQKFILCYKFL